jgi:hypothetical protein
LNPSIDPRIGARLTLLFPPLAPPLDLAKDFLAADLMLEGEAF